MVDVIAVRKRKEDARYIIVSQSVGTQLRITSPLGGIIPVVPSLAGPDENETDKHNASSSFQTCMQTKHGSQYLKMTRNIVSLYLFRRSLFKRSGVRSPSC